MTRTELLESVKARFGVLLVDDDQQFATMLSDALRKYRDKAGVRNALLVPKAGQLTLPNDFLAISTIKDSEQDAVFESVVNAGGQKAIIFGDDEEYPLTVSYFIDLLKIADTEPLPEKCIDLTSKYLQVLIERANDMRIKQIESLADGDVSDLSTPAEKDAALTIIEQQMAMEMSFSDIITVQPL